MENQNISLQVEKFPDLKSFLAGHRSPPDGKFTHTSMCRGKYFIPEEKMEEMYSLYTQDTFEKGKEQRLTEKPHDISPLRVDLDFRYTGNNLERRYTQEMIIEVAKRYMEPVEDWLFLEDNERLCFVTEKSNPQETTKKTEDGQKIYKDGVHLMWPYLLMGTELQLKFREHVYKNLEDVLGPMNLTNPYSDVVDKAVIDKNNWMLYGGQKMGSEPYKLTHVYRVSSDDAEEVEGAVEEYSNAELVRLLSVRSHYTKPLSEQDASVNIADITRTECQVRAEKEAELKEHLKEFVIKMSKYKAPKGPRKKKSKPKKLSEDELNLMKKCVEALNPQRASNYATWMEVGWALHNTDDRLLEDWITFSKQDQNYALTA